jgi:hypothetical protein
LTLAVALVLLPEDRSREDTSRAVRALSRGLLARDVQEHPLSFHLDSRLVQGLTERPGQEESKRLAMKMLDLYHNLAMLQGRAQGRLPAREGILLVREKKSAKRPEEGSHL